MESSWRQNVPRIIGGGTTVTLLAESLTQTGVYYGGSPGHLGPVASVWEYAGFDQGYQFAGDVFGHGPHFPFHLAVKPDMH